MIELGRLLFIRDWRSLVARLIWDQEAVGSSPASRTIIFRDMAQMVARFLGVEEATGSSPVISTRSNSGALRRPGYYKSNRHTQQIYSIKNIIGSSPIPAAKSRLV